VSIAHNKEDLDPNLHWEQTKQSIEEISQLKSSTVRLETGFAGLQRQVEGGFASINVTLKDMNQPKPGLPYVQLGMFALVSLGAMSSLLAFIFNLTISNVQRETDMRFSDVKQGFNTTAGYRATLEAEMEERFKVDALNDLEQAEMRGKIIERIEQLYDWVTIIELRGYQRQVKIDDTLGDMATRLERTHTGMVAEGDYLKEHVNKSGTAGHPTSH